MVRQFFQLVSEPCPEFSRVCVMFDNVDPQWRKGNLVVCVGDVRRCRSPNSAKVAMGLITSMAQKGAVGPCEANVVAHQHHGRRII